MEVVNLRGLTASTVLHRALVTNFQNIHMLVLVKAECVLYRICKSAHFDGN